MLNLRVLATAALSLALLAAAPAQAAPLDQAAEGFVKLTLRIGEHEAGYVDAYYGPKAWADDAKAHPGTTAELKAEADRLIARVQAVDAKGLAPVDARRRAFLLAQLKAERFRLDMIDGKKPAFRDEAQALFNVRPDLKPLSAYDPVLARIEALFPGSGDLSERIEAFKAGYVIPKDRLEPVMQAAIAECRRRTLAHIKLPPNEDFKLEFVTGKPWSGYNWYKGAAQSLIQVNTDLPIFVDRAVDLGCHEGYPGHHTHNVLLEDRLVKGHGWVEFQAYPLFSPLSFIAEGEGNYGYELAFPGEQRTEFEAKVLYPLAGLDPATAPKYAALREAQKDLAGARMTIAADYLDGKLTRDQAVAASQKYMLISKARAEQSVSFTDNYRSYVINYGLGEQMVRHWIESQGADPDARWKAMERLLSQPSTAADLGG
ncbi:MAG: hypothetical protein ACREE0_03440 [Phenylobacterium sp.]